MRDQSLDNLRLLLIQQLLVIVHVHCKCVAHPVCGDGLLRGVRRGLHDVPLLLVLDTECNHFVESVVARRYNFDLLSFKLQS